MSSKTLALAIPTYQRADILEDNLRRIAPTLRALDIAVYILDDSGDDLTAAAMQRLADTQLKLHYRRNRPALRHDANSVAALTAPDTDFVWLLGDSCQLDSEGVRVVHAALAEQDFVFVNCRDDDAQAAIEHLDDAALRRFMANRVWELSYTGATVYARRVIDWWSSDPAHQVVPNFPQLSFSLGFLSAPKQANATWIGLRVVRGHPRKTQSYWLAEALSVWGLDWHRVISQHRAAFDVIDLDPVLRSHARHTRVLSGKHLLVLRAQGLFSPQVLAQWPQLRDSCAIAGLRLRLVAALPRRAATVIVALRPSWRRRYLPTPPNPGVR